jgi:tRNA threonylcarbamoyladenosine biosynthesis protein TsaE
MRSLGEALGKALASVRDGALVIAIEGELGTGKTTLVGGVLHAFGVAATARSPTYTLIEPYDAAGRQIYHLDLYRLVDPHEVEGLGIRDLLHPAAVLLIEWPSRGAGMLPPADLDISIQYATAPPAAATPDASARLLMLRPGSSAGHKLVEQIVAATSQ